MLDYTKANELGEFYELGKSIRLRNSSFNTGWQDEKIIDSLFGQPGKTCQLFTAEKGTIAARLLAFTDPETKAHAGFIGWYECDPDIALHHEILNAAETWLRDQGCTDLVGPINGNTWNNYRFNLNCDYPLFPGEPFQPVYYPEFWKISGFQTVLHYVTEIPPKEVIQPMTREQLDALLDSHQLKAYNLTKQVSETYFEKLHAFYHLCFKDNPLFHPIDLTAYSLINEKVQSVLNEDHSFIITNANDNVIAIFISYIDYYYLKNKEVEEAPPAYKTHSLLIKTLAVHPDYRNKQLGTLMINYMNHLAYQNGYERVIHALMYDDNISAKKGKEKFKTTILREYSLFTKKL